ncbi:MAG TPA: NADH-quinone oxidoreductase subunit L [Candidatus Cybelea sp.]|nr:NADH-quinone oxidoreductase subunit L [Candidatus Cybelea sp.]
MFVAIVFLPLLGAILAGLFGRVLGDRGSQAVTCIPVTVSALLSCIALWQVAFQGHTTTVTLFTWIVSGDFVADWALKVDQLTAVMLVVVGVVSAVVHVYSVGYMAEEQGKPRFMAYLSLFTFAMLMLVTSGNFVQMYFGWEGVGLCSYLLIGFWYDRPSANAAAIKAFVVNRIGDFGFALGIMGVFLTFHSVDFATVFAAAPAMAGKSFSFLGHDVGILNTLTFLLFLGAMGKSAQMPLHTWLPDAMEGPTPVSALIHAATMVTAGVFLVARCSPMFEYAPLTLNIVAAVGASTALFAATVALVQNDIKRVVAYSTCSQLGYMFFAAGVSAYPVAIFHLFTHAFFKALLFLGSGSVIHAVGGEQDMRKMGGLGGHIKVTCALMWIGSLALAGVPFFAGYFSKDAILESSFAAGTSFGDYGFALGLTAAVLTAFYSWRLLFMTFNGEARADHHVMEHIHESPAIMIWPLYVLAAGAVFAGALFAGPMVGEEWRQFWGDSIVILDSHKAIDLAHHVPLWVKLAPVVAGLLGIAVAVQLYLRRTDLPGALARMHQPLYQFLLNKWYFDEIYDFALVNPAKWLGRVLWKGGDGFIIDGFGPDGMATSVLALTRRAVQLQTGYIFHYAFAMLIGVVLLVTLYFYVLGGH